MPSRTSVVSLNITVAPARTSRSVQKPTAGLAVTPLKASLPPHCTPTTSALAGTVSRRRALSRTRCSSACAHDRVDHRHEADVTGVLQADDIELELGRLADVGDPALIDDRAGPPQAIDAPSGGRRRRRLGGPHREAAGRQEPIRLQLLAPQAHDQQLAAEVRIQADVAQRADRDDRVRRVDRDAAAVAVLQADHIVDVRVLRQQLGLDPLDREIDHPGDALHRGRDRQDVARAHRAVGVAITLETEAGQRGLRGGLDGRDRQAVERTRLGQLQQALVDPAPGCDRAEPRGRSRRRSAAPPRLPPDRPARPCGPAARGRAAPAHRPAPCQPAGRRRSRRSRRCRAHACGSSGGRKRRLGTC